MLRSRIPLIAAELHARLDPAVRAAAEVVATGARARVPVGAPEVHLRDAIHVERNDTATYSVLAGDENVFYGHMVEFGTSHSAPRPFMVPAAEDGRAELAALARAALRGL